MYEVDITVVLNVHSEGMLAHPTVLSLQKAKLHAERHGLTVDVLVVQDKPSSETLEYFSECKVLDFTNLLVAFGDLGLSRNAGTQAAKGKWIAFLDGDDLWGTNWLTACHSTAIGDMRNVVWHPEASQYFALEPHIYRHIDMEDPTFDLLTLMTNNYWTSLSFAGRDLYLSYPYPPTHLDKHLGYEDWSWNTHTISQGVLHKVVPGTVHFIRQKPLSLVRQTAARFSLMYPTLLFKDFIDNRERYESFLLS
jgi:hypothetical protein